MRIGWCYSLIFLLTGCASTVQSVRVPDLNKRVEDPAKARIYLIRPSIIGTAIKADVWVGGRSIGKLAYNSFLTWEEPAGEITISVQAYSNAPRRIDLKLSPGSVYYIQADVASAVNWQPLFLSEAEGRELVSKCKAPKSE